MPWLPEYAPRHDHPGRPWSEAANNVLGPSGDERRAIRSDNAALAKARRRETPSDDAFSTGPGGPVA